jgi:DUF177 domain-containing protein
MKLHLTTIREARNPLTETFPPEQLGMDPEMFRQPVEVSAEVDWSGIHAEVDLHIVAPAEFVCDRCADDITLLVETDSRVRILLQDPPDDDEDHDGIIFAGQRGKFADLTEEIVNAVLLAIPLIRLCREDCKGFCPQCYTNLNEGTCEHVGKQDPVNDEPRGETIADKLAKKQHR